MKQYYEKTDLIVFSQIRFDFDQQRVLKILGGYDQFRRIYYFEEPHYGISLKDLYLIQETGEKVQVVIPYLKKRYFNGEESEALKELINGLLEEECIEEYSVLYLNAEAITFSEHLTPQTILFGPQYPC